MPKLEDPDLQSLIPFGTFAQIIRCFQKDTQYVNSCSNVKRNFFSLMSLYSMFKHFVYVTISTVHIICKREYTVLLYGLRKYLTFITLNKYEFTEKKYQLKKYQISESSKLTFSQFLCWQISQYLFQQGIKLHVSLQ